MIDEKKIEEAAKKLINTHYGAYYGDLSGFDAIQTQMYNDGFRDATKWTIEEFLKGLWHDAKEEPKSGGYIIVKYFDSEEREMCYECDNIHHSARWEEYTTLHCITKWCYLSDILPKEGGEK